MTTPTPTPDPAPAPAPVGDQTTAPPPEPPAAQPTSDPSPAQDTEGTEGTDWKAEARKWEKRAKENSRAAAELEKLKQQSMTEAERAAAEAEKRGRAAAAREYGARLARAELRAVAAAKGLTLGDDLIDLIDTSRFVGEDGDVDEAAIKQAVAKLAKLAPKPSGASGGDFTGGNGGGTPPKSLQDQIREAEAKGDWRTARRLKTQFMINH